MENIKNFNTFVNESFHMPDGTPIAVDHMHRPITGPIKEASDEMITLNVTISNIDKSTADDFLKMFAFMEWCGNVGSGRSFKAYFDGDGHFRPNIKVEGIDLKNVDLSGDYDDEKNDTLDLDFGA
jgi:hypothetical protein